VDTLDLGEQVSNRGVGVRLGIEHQTGNSSRSNKEGSSSRNDGNGPRWQQGNDVELSLLVSVGEGVVSGGHVVERSSQVELDQTSIEVFRGSIQFHAVLDISLGSVFIIVVLGQQFLIGQAVSLVQHGHSQSQGLGLEHGSVRRDPSIGGGLGSRVAADLDDVASVSLVSSFSGITSGVGITTSPLEVNVVTNSGVQESGDEIVFSGGESLDDVSSLSSDVDVVDTSSGAHTTGSGSNVEGVRSVLEGSSELGGIHGQLMRSTILSNNLVFRDGGVGSVGSPVNESSIGSVSIGSHISSGDVVSQSESTVAVVLANAFFITTSGESDVDGVIITSSTSTQMVFSGPGGLNAKRSSNLPCGNSVPCSLVSSTSNGVVSSVGFLSSGHSASTSGLDVLGFSSVERAIGFIGSQDGHISPGSRSPIGIIISLFGAFIAVSVSVVVLSGED